MSNLLNTSVFPTRLFAAFGTTKHTSTSISKQQNICDNAYAEHRWIARALRVHQLTTWRWPRARKSGQLAITGTSHAMGAARVRADPRNGAPPTAHPRSFSFLLGLLLLPRRAMRRERSPHGREKSSAPKVAAPTRLPVHHEGHRHCSKFRANVHHRRDHHRRGFRADVLRRAGDVDVEDGSRKDS